jgi:hypothetical protein
MPIAIPDSTSWAAATVTPTISTPTINSHRLFSHYRQWPPRLHCVSHDVDYDLFYDTVSLVKYSNDDYKYASDDPYDLGHLLNYYSILI